MLIEVPDILSPNHVARLKSQAEDFARHDRDVLRLNTEESLAWLEKIIGAPLTRASTYPDEQAWQSSHRRLNWLGEADDPPMFLRGSKKAKTVGASNLAFWHMEVADRFVRMSGLTICIKNRANKIDPGVTHYERLRKLIDTKFAQRGFRNPLGEAPLTDRRKTYVLYVNGEDKYADIDWDNTQAVQAMSMLAKRVNALRVIEPKLNRGVTP